MFTDVDKCGGAILELARREDAQYVLANLNGTTFRFKVGFTIYAI